MPATTNAASSAEGQSAKHQDNTVAVSKAERKDKKEKKDKKKKAKKDTKAKKSSKRKGDDAEAADVSDETVPAKKGKVEATSAAPAVTPSEAKEFYDKHQITVTGINADSFVPAVEFSQTSFGPEILSTCAKFARPTPIQSACWPLISASRDVIGIAETGSGKTFAFALPIIHQVSQKYGAKASGCKKPLVLVISPTRELAIQTHEQCVEAGKKLGITSMCLYGGSNKYNQIKELKQTKPAVIVATPGRLLDVVENDNALDLSDVSYLVLDEADRMLDQGFEKDIRTIIGMLPQGTSRQTVMFSATWPVSVRGLADTFLRSPISVSIGGRDIELAINERVTQIVDVLDDPKKKNYRLLNLLSKYHKSRKNRVLVFALYKKEAGRLEEMLQGKGYNCVAIHGDKPQSQRLEAIEAFRKGTIPLLVATDVAARGLDVPDVEYVINYTFPLTIDEYTHRCGRTARAGKKGVAHTFFTMHDKAHSGSLINMLKSANMPVPDELLKFGTTVKKKQHSSYGAFFKDVDMTAKPVKIVFD
ncbi:RNA-dependent ATPase [Coemansia sp. RSA 552]|nr:RNA-dependent ATPase [Coemansia sp. RSA 552]